jgi:hypothetical protein
MPLIFITLINSISTINSELKKYDGIRQSTFYIPNYKRFFRICILSEITVWYLFIRNKNRLTRQFGFSFRKTYQ